MYWACYEFRLGIYCVIWVWVLLAGVEGMVEGIWFFYFFFCGGVWGYSVFFSRDFVNSVGGGVVIVCGRVFRGI